MEDYVHTGTIKYWKREKSFGFIVVDGPYPDVYCHRHDFTSAHEGNLAAAGQRVAFKVEADIKGYKAHSVRVID